MATLSWISTSSTDWNTGANWSTGSAPATGDTVYFDGTGTANVDTNLSHAGVTLAALYITQAYTGTIGTASSPLVVGATIVRIGDPSNATTQPNGSGRINLDQSSVQTTWVVVNTCQSSSESTLPPVRLKGTHASNKLIVYSGLVGVAVNAVADVATISEVDIQSPTASGSNAPTVLLSSGCTLTTINQSAGNLTINSAATTVTQSAGTLTTQGSGAITTMTVGGTAYLKSTGTITTLNVIGGGTADFSGDAQAKTVTTLKAYKASKVNLNNGVKNSVTLTNPLALQNCFLSDIGLTSWINNTVALA